MNTLTTSIDLDYIRSDFPTLKREVNGRPLVYFDNGASAMKPQVVIDSISNFYQNYYSNVHRGIHELSQEATNAYEAVRETIRKHINAEKDTEVIFNYGTTDGINIIATSFGEKYINAGDEIIVSHMEHHANIVPWQMLCERKGAKLKVIPITETGELDMAELKALITENTKLISVVHVSNVLGTVNPIKEITTLAHKHGVAVLVDGSQAIPHMRVDVQDLDADFYVFTGHKVFGPTGTGVLYGKEKWLEAMPPYRGGGDMIDNVTFEKTTYNDLPHKFEAGTPHIAGMIGLGKAIDYINQIGLENIEAHEQELLEYITEKLQAIEGLTIMGTAKHKACVLSFNIDGVHPLDVGTLLNEYGIAVRTGQHCCQPIMDRYRVHASIRASLAFYNTKSEIDYFIGKLLKVKEMLA